MIVTSLEDDEGRMYAFEIDNAYISLRTVIRLLRLCDGVEITATRRTFSRDEIHVKFKYEGVDMIVWEPYGDNSKYWVGPEHADECVSVSNLFSVFEQCKVPTWKGVVGDIVSLKFCHLIKRIMH